ncbi:hypothetical protein ACM66B_000992 [Microbotryomycetes sp. NB124-2]
MPKARTRPSPAQPAPATALGWPELMPPDQLLVEHLNDDLITVDGLIQPKQLKQWRTFVNSLNMAAPEPAKPGHAERKNFRFQVNDSSFAQTLWTRTGLDALCREHVPSRVKGKQAVGLNSNIRVYRYDAESFFGPHYDDDVYDAVTKQRSEWTLLIYLTGQSDGVVGGETAFYPQATNKSDGPRLDVALVAGRALLHRHGHACMLHEGRKVEQGVKWVLRSDVMFA